MLDRVGGSAHSGSMTYPEEPTMTTFTAWLADLDTICRAAIGLSVHDLPDMAFRSMYADECPADAETLACLMADAGLRDESDHVWLWA